MRLVEGILYTVTIASEPKLVIICTRIIQMVIGSEFISDYSELNLSQKRSQEVSSSEFFIRPTYMFVYIYNDILLLDAKLGLLGHYQDNVVAPAFLTPETVSFCCRCSH